MSWYLDHIEAKDTKPLEVNVSLLMAYPWLGVVWCLSPVIVLIVTSTIDDQSQPRHPQK
jgi:hypothetical protein